MGRIGFQLPNRDYLFIGYPCATEQAQRLIARGPEKAVAFLSGELRIMLNIRSSQRRSCETGRGCGMGECRRQTSGRDISVCTAYPTFVESYEKTT